MPHILVAATFFIIFKPAPVSELSTVNNADILDAIIFNVQDSVSYHSNTILTGKASYYHDKFDGRTCAWSKIIFRQSSNYVAHTSLPFGTEVIIKNTRNKKTAMGTVVDRGPFNVDKRGKAIRPLSPHRDRIIDVSSSIAKKLDMIGPGVVPVEVEIL